MAHTNSYCGMCPALFQDCVSFGKPEVLDRRVSSGCGFGEGEAMKKVKLCPVGKRMLSERKKNPQDATLRNIRALKNRVALLERDLNMMFDKMLRMQDGINALIERLIADKKKGKK